MIQTLIPDFLQYYSPCHFVSEAAYGALRVSSNTKRPFKLILSNRSSKHGSNHTDYYPGRFINRSWPLSPTTVPWIAFYAPQIKRKQNLIRERIGWANVRNQTSRVQLFEITILS